MQVLVANTGIFTQILKESLSHTWLPATKIRQVEQISGSLPLIHSLNLSVQIRKGECCLTELSTDTFGDN